MTTTKVKAGCSDCKKRADAAAARREAAAKKATESQKATSKAQGNTPFGVSTKSRFGR